MSAFWAQRGLASNRFDCLPGHFGPFRIVVGVSFNLQRALKSAFGNERERMVHKVGHEIAEYYSVPYTTLRVLETTRSIGGDEIDEE